MLEALCLALPLLAAAELPATSTGPAGPFAASASSATALRLVPPEAWPELRDELPKDGLLKAARRSLAYLEKIRGEKRFFRIGDRDYAAGELSATADALIEAANRSKTPEELRDRLKREFDLYQSAGSDGNGKVVFSAYYQPILSASLKRTAKYKHPIYRKPPDMVEAELEPFNPKWKGETILGRVTREKRLVPYFDRREIDVRRALAGKGLEIAWFADAFDRLDLHIQGSGILRLTNGRKVLARFAATNALPYKSVGAAAAGSGAIPRAELTRDRLQQYLKEHPEGEAWLISQNPRYTFFELAPLPEDGEPFGTTQEPLTSGRSIAIDPKFIPLGAVAYFETVMPHADRQGRLLGLFPASRIALCQDTGGAILGPGRVDIYVGSGGQAKTVAVNQWTEGKLFVLLKKLPPRER